MHRHPSNKAKSGPPPDRPPTPAPPPPPRWRSWLLPIGLLLSLLLLLLPNQMEQSRVTDLNYAPELKQKIMGNMSQRAAAGLWARGVRPCAGLGTRLTDDSKPRRCSLLFRPHRLSVRTGDSQSSKRGSIPRGGTTLNRNKLRRNVADCSFAKVAA